VVSWPWTQEHVDARLVEDAGEGKIVGGEHREGLTAAFAAGQGARRDAVFALRRSSDRRHPGASSSRAPRVPETTTAPAGCFRRRGRSRERPPRGRGRCSIRLFRPRLAPPGRMRASFGQFRAIVLFPGSWRPGDVGFDEDRTLRYLSQRYKLSARRDVSTGAFLPAQPALPLGESRRSRTAGGRNLPSRASSA
jgi:hypothetical protein